MSEIIERVVTVETRLQKDSELVNYLNIAVTEYELVRRRIWSEMIDPEYKKNYPTDVKFEQHCRLIYGLHSRAINSIIRELRGFMKAYMELKKTELKQLKNKIQSQQKKVNKSLAILTELKPLVTGNIASEKQLNTYRQYKFSLYYQKNRLNRLNIKYNNLQYQIDNKIYKVCFGTKDLFRRQHYLEENGFNTHTKWYNTLIKNRDKNIWLSGSVNEKDGNQMCALTYDDTTDTFSIRLRKVERGNYSQYDPDKYITYTNLNFKHNKQDIIDLVNKQQNNLPNKQAINFRFHREGNKWYLQIVYAKSYYRVNSVTRKDNGVIGLDFNNGFIQLAETDKYGNLIHLQKYDLMYHGTGNKAKTEIEQTISQIISYATKKGKDIAIEDLDFKSTKAKQTKAKSKKGKKYNDMIHKFDYSRYKQKMQDLGFNKQVTIILVKPHNTSKIAKQKYCKPMKLTSHQGATFVIARKCQGFKDKLKTNKKSA